MFMTRPRKSSGTVINCKNPPMHTRSASAWRQCSKRRGLKDLSAAIDDEIQVFQDNVADAHVLSVWFDESLEDAVAALERHASIGDQRAHGGSVVCITDLGFSSRWQTERFRHFQRQHES